MELELLVAMVGGDGLGNVDGTVRVREEGGRATVGITGEAIA